MEAIVCLFLAAAQLLFNTGVQDVESGKLDRARLTLQTLVNTYPNDPLAREAKDQLDAINLYEEGQDRMRQGRYQAAAFTFQTLTSVYPESTLAAMANEARRKAEEAHESLTVRLTVRSVDWKWLGLAPAEIRKLFEDREVRLAAGREFDPRDVEQARVALTELLNAQIRTEARMAGAHEVDVVLTRVK